MYSFIKRNNSLSRPLHKAYQEFSLGLIEFLDDSPEELLSKLVDRVETYLLPGEVSLIRRAFYFAYDAHSRHERPRNSGHPYISHPAWVALFLAYMRLDADTIAASLLHDVAEDCPDVDIRDIESEFNSEIASLVDGVTKIPGESEETNLKLADNAMVNIRSLLIKLADNLHNMLTLDPLSPEKQRRNAQRSAETFIPLAENLGIWVVKRLLEDFTFRSLEPYAYNNIAKWMEFHEQQCGRFADEVRSKVQGSLDDKGIPAKVIIRPRHAFSIYKTLDMCNKLNQFFDWFSNTFRLVIVVEKEDECYLAMSAIHKIAENAANSVKDNRWQPKGNSYMSIDTTVDIDGHLVDVQIRISTEDNYAELGMLSHWHSQQGHPKQMTRRDRMRWRGQIYAWFDENLISSLS